MDVNFELGDLKFVWDSDKAEINWKKHKIKFEDAALVFFDENLIDDYDEFNSDDEERNRVIGKVGRILFVIYTEREDKKRIISARLANKMNNFIINGVKVSEEQYNRIKNMPQLSDEEIDYSDIPPLTDEELKLAREKLVEKYFR